MCIHPGCKFTPSFNKEGETKGLYCSAHKLQWMVDVRHAHCIKCNKIPVFNKESEAKGLYCFEHKEDGMVNVISKRCLHEECKTLPTYNKEGEKNRSIVSNTKKMEW